jgi:hypothetical protein
MLQGDIAALNCLLAPRPLRHLALAALSSIPRLTPCQLHRIILTIQAAAVRLAHQCQYLAVVIGALLDTVRALDCCSRCLRDWATCAIQLLEQPRRCGGLPETSRVSARGNKPISGMTLEALMPPLLDLLATLREQVSPASPQIADIFKATTSVAHACASLWSMLSQLQSKTSSGSAEVEVAMNSCHRTDGDLPDRAMQRLDELTAAFWNVREASVSLCSARAAASAQQVRISPITCAAHYLASQIASVIFHVAPHIEHDLSRDILSTAPEIRVNGLVRCLWETLHRVTSGCCTHKIHSTNQKCTFKVKGCRLSEVLASA